MLTTDFIPAEIFNPSILPKQDTENRIIQYRNSIPSISRIAFAIRIKENVCNADRAKRKLILELK